MRRKRITADEAAAAIQLLRRALAVIENSRGGAEEDLELCEEDEIAIRLVAEALEVIQCGYDELDESFRLRLEDDLRRRSTADEELY